MEESCRPWAAIDAWAETVTGALPTVEYLGTAAPTTLLALLALRSGDRARAGVLVDQSLTCDATHRLALLVQDALSAGLAPGWIRRTT